LRFDEENILVKLIYIPEPRNYRHEKQRKKMEDGILGISSSTRL